MTKFRNALHNEKGFTLIELLVVVIIIGILAAVALPNLMGASEGAKEKRVVADLKVIETAISGYYAENSDYPATESALVGTDKQLKSWPTDPWGTAYNYNRVSPTEFDVTTSGSVYSLDETGIH